MVGCLLNLDTGKKVEECFQQMLALPGKMVGNNETVSRFLEEKIPPVRDRLSQALVAEMSGAQEVRFRSGPPLRHLGLSVRLHPEEDVG